MTSHQELEIGRYLYDIGACLRCALRIVKGDTKTINFQNPSEEFFLFRYMQEPDAKRMRRDYCIVCLDTLSDASCNVLFSTELIQTAKQYDSDTYSLHITYPKCLVIREFVIEQLIKKKFPEYASDVEMFYRTIPPVMKAVVVNTLDTLLGKKQVDDSHLNIEITFTYSLDEQEVLRIVPLDKNKYYGRMLNPKFNGHVYTKQTLKHTLKCLPQEVFGTQIPLPPTVPGEPVEFAGFKVVHDAIYIEGRFLKLNPYLVVFPYDDPNKQHEDCIMSDLKTIFSAITKTELKNIEFRTINTKLPAYRVLGVGRPFILKFEDPKITKFEDCRHIEMLANRQAVFKGYGIKDLQLGNRKSIKRFTFYKTSVMKSCNILCTVADQNIRVEKIINYINKMPKPLDVKRLFPECYTKPDIIYSISHIVAIKAEEANSFYLDIKSPWGFSEFDFITGRDNRMYPSLEMVVQTKLKVIKVDYMERFTTWPTLIDYGEGNDPVVKSIVKEEKVD